jgi:hypothetical protein
LTTLEVEVVVVVGTAGNSKMAQLLEYKSDDFPFMEDK